MSEQLVDLVVDHGAIALFGILIANCLGMPFPTSLLLMALGSFVGQGEMELWPLLFAGISGAVIGDQIGYFLGRLGGNLVLHRLTRRPRAARTLGKAQALVWRWGGPGIYFSRWLLSPLGPWVNLATGLARYPWPRFAIWGFLGLSTWIGLYFGLGLLFSRSVQSLADLTDNLTWMLLFTLLTLLIGWLLLRRLRQGATAKAVAPASDSPSDTELR